MEYKIINANASEGTITVRYLYKDFNVITLTIDVPIVDGKYLTGQALEDLIQSRAPLELLQRRIDIENASNFQDITSKVTEVVPPTPEVVPTVPVIPMPTIVVDKIVV
jgi:hypothetical protein